MDIVVTPKGRYDIRGLAHTIRSYYRKAEAGQPVPASNLMTWYGIVLNIAGMDYCDECGNEGLIEDMNYPYEGADSATCKVCAAAAELMEAN